MHQEDTGITYADLATMSIDECEVHNRFLDALLEARFIDRQRQKKGG